MKEKYLLLFFLVTTTTIFAQHKYTLSGSISDASNGERLLGVNFVIKELYTGTSTNEYGFYSITLPEGKYTLSIEYIGYGTREETIVLNKNIRKDYKLIPEEVTLTEVEITAHNIVQKTEVRKPKMSVATILITIVRKLPVLTGEVDIIKTLMQMPGVSNTGGVSSGFNVHGGAADQNLVLLDEATIFNTSYLSGFLSVFNADAVRDTKLYEGGIPACYGGRIASVLDIYQKEGNRNKFAATGGIGILSSRLFAEGPILKDKASFPIGGRASYAHLFLELSDNKDSAYFYDLNTKLSYQLDSNNALYLSDYSGRNSFILNENLTNTYSNALVNLRWNHLFTDKPFSNLSAIYSNYDYKFDFGFIDMKWTSGIENFNLKYDFKNYISEKFKLAYGFQGLYYVLKPGKIVPKTSASTIQERILEHRYAAEMGFYADAEQKLGDALTLSYGLRFSNFYSLGKRTVSVYANSNPVGYNANQQVYYQGSAIGTKYYGSSRIIDLCSNFELRFAMGYAFSDAGSVKASYACTARYVHLISNATSPSPLNVWASNDEFIKPQIVDQVALGCASNIFEDKYNVEVETYYKKVQNHLDYVDGANLVANEAVKRVLLSGENRAYSLEVLLRKNTGKLTGWIAYTLSKSKMRTKGCTPDEIGINYGDWYSTAYDKPHDLSIMVTYEASPKWTFGAVFNLQSGLPTNYPVGRYSYLGRTLPVYSKRNEHRLLTYHRLDLSATYIPKCTSKRWKGEWVFGVYNVYNRKNAVSVSFRENEDTKRNEAVELSIFGIIPSVTYNFSF